MTLFSRSCLNSNVPSTVPGLVAWYRADVGVTVNGSNHVTNVADLSGNGNNLIASTGLTWTAGAQAGANGQVGFNCDGSGTLFQNTAVITGSNAQWTALFVAQTSITASLRFGFFNGNNGTGGSGYIINDGANSRRSWYVTSSGPAWSSAGLTTGFEATCWLNQGATKAVALNTRTPTSLGAGSETTVSNSFFGLGGWANSSSDAWQGVIMELAVFNTALSNAQVALLESYCGARYSIAIGP